MTKDNDPQLYTSGYDRNRLDRYWTHPWMTQELQNHLLKDTKFHVWEPAAGRGDMSRALIDCGHRVYSSDIDMSEFDYDIGPGEESSFLEISEVPLVRPEINAIITNPPYSEPWRGIADDFVEHSLSFIEKGHINFVAMLLRSEFKSGKSERRQRKFGSCKHYGGELVLTTRPRWDYGDPDAPENAAPRHNFSWFFWVRNRSWNHAVQIFSYMPKGFKP